MSKVISIHEYVLKPGVDPEKFESAIASARASGLLKLPGLISFRFVRGVKGPRTNMYTAIWEYESRQAWENLWGSPESPLTKQDYPQNWKVWEDEILAPFLAQDPDSIKFTSYQEF